MRGRCKQNKGRGGYHVDSANGKVRLTRTRWYARGEGSDSPVDRLVDEAESLVSVGVRQLSCRQGMNAMSFARGCEDLAATAQVEVGEELFRQIVESEGKAVLKAAKEEQLELDWSASQGLAKRPDGSEVSRIYASSDGVMVASITDQEKQNRRQKVKQKRAERPAQERRELKPLRAAKTGTDQRYKQLYLTALFDQEQSHRLVGVTRKNVRGLEQLLKREAARVRLLAAVERIGLVDGAVCLRSTMECLPLLEIVLDFYHLSEHVGTAAVQTLGEQTVGSQQWLADVLHTVRHEGYGAFFRKLLDWRSGLRGSKRAAADKLINYVAAREKMIVYEKCEANGWTVGTGTMESMCGVTTRRVKGNGQRWDLDNAEAMVGLEALRQSTGLWEKYWSNALQHRN